MGSRKITEYFCDRCEAQIMDHSRVHYVRPPDQANTLPSDPVELCADCRDKCDETWLFFMSNKQPQALISTETAYGRVVEARRLIGFMTNEKIAEAARLLDTLISRDAMGRPVPPEVIGEPDPRKYGFDSREEVEEIRDALKADATKRPRDKFRTRKQWMDHIREELRKNPHLIITNTSREDDKIIAQIREEVRAEKASAMIHKAEILMAKKVRHDDDGA